ncbi:MAG: glycosyltransferase family 2 protein [Nanoarchaeota archaeon]|nr:glycosyltransferase family 2 protein [Nanoarchaeota archaeon]
MIHIIITTFKEPSIKKAIESVLNQNIKEEYELIISAPDEETKNIVEIYKKNNPQIKYFKDPGKGKSYALNLLLKNLYKNNLNDVLILTDGDVYTSKNSINEIMNKFEEKKVGVVTARPVSQNPRNNMFGYWSHLLLDVGAHEISRKKRYKENKFIECTGYLFAFRNSIITKFPLDVAEDAIIPYYFWEKNYKIAYAEKALVYVKWPTNLKDWIKQKKRAADAHTKLTKYAKNHPKVKSFKSEIIEGGVKGFFHIFSYPKNPKEFLWTLLLFPLRLYIWLDLHYDLKFKRKQYQDGWERVDSTKN